MTSNDSDPWDGFEWDPVSEAQLQAIEASSSSMRRSFTASDSPTGGSSPKSKSRRLTNWSLQSDSLPSPPCYSTAPWSVEPSSCTTMASKSDDPWEGFEWDPLSEAQVQAIEASFSSSSSSKPSFPASDSDSSNHNSKCRRLPNWSLQSPWSGAPSACTRVNYRVKYQSMKFGGKIIYCRTVIEAEKASAELLQKINAKKEIINNNNNQVSLGFDIEWKPTFKRGETTRKAALMQICMDNICCYIFHIIHTGVPNMLKSLLEDNSSLKVGVCIANDAWKMANDYDVKIQPLIDLSNLANNKLVGPTKKWSLSSLTETITCKQLEKPSKIRMGNWEAEFLSKEQLNYAATDAYISWYLYEVLNDMPDPNIEKEQGT